MKNKIMTFMEEKVLAFGSKVASQRHLAAIKDGMMLSIPFLIVGSIFLIIANLPIASYMNYMQTDPQGMVFKQWLTYPVTATFDMIAIISLLGISYNLAKSYNLNTIISVSLSFISFVLVTPLVHVVGDTTLIALSTKYTGSQGLFVAILISLFSVEMYRIITKKNIVIKMPESVPDAVSKSFAALIPAGIIVIILLAVKIGLEQTAFDNIHNVIATLLTEPLTKISGSFWGAIAIILFMQIMWCCGIHGAAVVWGVMLPVLNVMMDANRVAFENGQAIPNILTKEWFNVFVMIGGSGGTLGLVVLMVFFAKSTQLKEIGKLSIGAAIFNVNEPVLFGLPIVMNPVLMIPFIFGPVIVTMISYGAMYFNVVARVVTVVPFTMPVGIGGFLLTGGNISGAVLQIVNLLILTLIYYPFFKAYDKQLLNEENGITSV
ncbi:PTS cellobiose transporter subunit IIC [Enterococcus rivorum]|uniref:PTS cellobiose transporter subunit IIC n=1 Tax=Enterococcus rivorum TaxID=762845 RepID=UPI0009FF1656|nr:PTS cellobiose transporter subunit IIC [Enterococcus rivorum]MBP2097431.1 PTS system cellobiose-specific IIC component [Enterococcus rivorum]